jgi:peptide/nickel transport system substrate-binding protein
MRTRTRSSLAVASLTALALVAAACSSNSSKSGGPGPSGPVSLNNGLQALNESGTPHSGGTLNMLGAGDVDYMDYNISYYSIGYLGQRMWVRGLYEYPGIVGKVFDVEPDLATAAPVVSNGGLTYTITIRSGAMWDSSPARPVTAADAVRGLMRACNPVTRFGGLPDFSSLIKGYTAFCAGFAKVKPTVAAIKAYVSTHTISGYTASGQTLTITLVHPASYFASELTLPAFNPAPIESLNYLPVSAASYQHTIADGPYKIVSYVPAKSISFVRNPVWNAASDPIRKAYVNAINIKETGNPVANQTVLQTSTAAGSMEWDTFPPVASIPGLIGQMQHGSKNFSLGPTYSTNPYIIFNNISPNNKGALGNVKVRQAISFAIDRAHLIQDDNGPTVSPPLTHVLPNGINGSQFVPSTFDDYPYNPAKAKQLLAAAGYPHGLTLTFLYRTESTLAVKMFQTLQSDLAKSGITIKGLAVPSADFYTKYMYAPNTAKTGVWDVSLAGWGPDWYGDAAASFFEPLFYGNVSFPQNGGSNFGFYNDPKVNALIATAAKTGNTVTAGHLWAQIDQMVMADAPIYPITQPLQPNYHASYVHNAVYVPAIQDFDPTNVWLSTPGG